MTNDEKLRKRHWIASQHDWFSNEIMYHRDMKKYFSENKHVIWSVNTESGSYKVEYLYATPQ